MIKVNRCPVAPPSLSKGTYQDDDVQEQLLDNFAGKCYLCEDNAKVKPETEHLVPSHGDKAKELDWNNLFLSCSHCNSVKNQKQYEHDIIDCCREDPETLLIQTIDEDKDPVVPKIEPIGNSAEAINSANLLNDCFFKDNHPYRKAEADVKIKDFQEVMNNLFNKLLSWSQNHNDNDLRALRGMLDRQHLFAGFTRGYVRSHITDYPELKECVKLD